MRGSSPPGSSKLSQPLDIYMFMCVATEQICEACGEKYWQGDMLEDAHLKCDKCRGRKPPPEEYPLTREQWFEAIKKLQR